MSSMNLTTTPFGHLKYVPETYEIDNICFVGPYDSNAFPFVAYIWNIYLYACSCSFMQERNGSKKGTWLFLTDVSLVRKWWILTKLVNYQVGNKLHINILKQWKAVIGPTCEYWVIIFDPDSNWNHGEEASATFNYGGKCALFELKRLCSWLSASVSGASRSWWGSWINCKKVSFLRDKLTIKISVGLFSNRKETLYNLDEP